MRDDLFGSVAFEEDVRSLAVETPTIRVASTDLNILHELLYIKIVGMRTYTKFNAGVLVLGCIEAASYKQRRIL